MMIKYEVWQSMDGHTFERTIEWNTVTYKEGLENLLNDKVKDGYKLESIHTTSNTSKGDFGNAISTMIYITVVLSKNES